MLRLLILAALTWSGPVHAQSSLDRLGQRLTFASDDASRWARLSVMNEVSLYGAEEPVPGLLFSDATPLVAPRISVTADAGLGPRLLVHARLRADRGFDPAAEPDGDVRADEYFLQADLPVPGRVRLRAGKFATAFGGWVGRHLAWDNPLITAPVLYDDMVTITDAAAPADPAVFLGRRDLPENKPAWVPVVWGPSYATGAAVSAGAGSLDVTLEAKNAAPSARPEAWKTWNGPGPPTITGRLGWHPAPEWTLGVSFSEGPYLRRAAAETLPAGTGPGDFEQTTAGLDVAYERHALQLWAELVHSRFDVPRIGGAEVTGAFVELRYKTSPRVWIAGRWNQSWFDDAPGTDTSWDRNLRRADVGLGFRHSAHVQAKLEYSVSDQSGGNVNGNHVIAAQLVMWF